MNKFHFPFWLQKDNTVTVFLLVLLLGVGYSNARIHADSERANERQRIWCVEYDQPNAQAVLDVMRTLRFEVVPYMKNQSAREHLGRSLDLYFARTHNTINLPCDQYPSARTSSVLP